MPTNKIAAKVQIKDAARMSKERRQDIADWLRMHADDLEKDGNEYDAGFHGTFYDR